MKQVILTTVLSFSLVAVSVAQEKRWTMNDCMRYAVENSPKVKKQLHTNNTYKAEQSAAIASFFPSVNASIGAQFNYGRSIDPETNTYNNTSTFNNGYGLSASLPLFNAGQLINEWRLANVNRKLGKNDIQKIKDDLALTTLQAYMDVLYYRGTIKMASEKLTESNRTLYKISREEELGLKGKADVAQIEAQVAADDYTLTHQQNLYNTALLTLKDNMNYPSAEELPIDTLMLDNAYNPMLESVGYIYTQASETNPTALQAAFQLKTYKLQQSIMMGRFFPSVSVSAGISTNYFENLSSEATVIPFNSQFKNNRGEYVSFNVSIPLFDGLYRRTNYRRAKNNVRIAYEQQTEVLRQLQSAIEQAVLDREGFAKEAIQMDKKVKADELAYRVTLRKFETGLMSSLDLQISANTLITSKADLLQKKLMYLLKSKLVDYYKGESLVSEE